MENKELIIVTVVFIWGIITGLLISIPIVYQVFVKSDNKQLIIADVVEQNEQLVCDCKNCKPFPNHAAGFKKENYEQIKLI